MPEPISEAAKRYAQATEGDYGYSGMHDDARLLARAYCTERPKLIAALRAALAGYERNFKQDGRWISACLADEAQKMDEALAGEA